MVNLNPIPLVESLLLGKENEPSETRFMSIFILFLNWALALASTCIWDKPTSIGTLDPKLLDEQSGMAFSSVYPRIYHVNDSGSGPAVYWTDLEGKGTQTVEIKGISFVDAEDLGYGPCGADRCVFVADIGDNLEIRNKVRIIAIREQDLKERAEPFKIMEFSYPEGSQDAEALAVHPNGDIYIATKHYSRTAKSAYPARIYRIDKSWVNDANPQPHLLGEINIQEIFQAKRFWNNVVTSMSISPDGKKAVLLTYKDALMINIDFSTLKSGFKLAPQDYQKVMLSPLAQQESVSFKDNQTFVYSTEVDKKIAPALMAVRCANQGLRRLSSQSE